MIKPYYQDEWTTIYNADCRDVLPQLDKVDLVLTDPPYNVGLNYCDGDKRNDYKEWCKSWFNLLSEPIALTPGMVNLNMWHDIKQPYWTMAWLKSNQCSSSALGGFNVWEPILIYGKIKKHVPQDALLTDISTNQVVCGDHPCPKDEKSWTKITEYLTKKDWLILDPFLGSGTTCFCAKKLGRKSIGVEISEKYCEISAKRLRQSVMNFEIPKEIVEQKPLL